MVISAMGFKPDTITKKKNIEEGFSQMLHNDFYPGEGLNIFSNIENDVALVTVIRNLNNLRSIEK